jgi:hypothetical protein
MTDKLYKTLRLLRSEAAGQVIARYGPEAECRVETESAPGACRFHLRIVRDGQSLTQSAYVPLRMIELMPDADVRPFIQSLVEGAFRGGAE